MPDLDARQLGNMKQSAQNAEQTKVIRNANRFPLDYQHPTSHRYADIDLFYHYYGERGDRVPLRTAHSVRAFTFASPNEIDIYMRKQFVHVPMQAIYPRTWNDVLYPLPVDGDVAPLDGRANFHIVYYIDILIKRILAIKDSADLDYGGLPNNLLCFYLKTLDALQNVVSNGSLFAKLNIHLSDLVIVDYLGARYSFDKFISLLYSDIAESLYNKSISFAGGSTAANLLIWFGDPAQNRFPDNRPSVTTWHQLHDYIRQYNYDFIIAEFEPLPMTFFPDALSLPSNVSQSHRINIEALIAYQLSCAQFYTNDRVDNIFSANTYRNYIQMLQLQSFEPDEFEFNGVSYLYDIFSEHNFLILLDSLAGANIDDFIPFDAINQMFEFRRSLRFGDYFLGARLKPLAVGESSIPVVDGNVYVEDVTKSAALQRLRYNVNVIGRKIANQLIGLIPGKAPSTPQDIPTAIATQDFNIGKDQHEINNTGDAQVSLANPFAVTSQLNSGGSDFAFEIELAEPCIILGLVSFSIPRIYSKTIDRFAFHLDRYDMLIPQMQFVGDQEIYKKELFGLSTQSPDTPFAYNQRYSEYKQRYSYASGAFVEFLKSWEMITDNTDGVFVQGERTLNESYAHSIPSEFDRFYKSVSGNSLADYVHFIVKHYNTSTPERAMAWNPQPLL